MATTFKNGQKTSGVIYGRSLKAFVEALNYNQEVVSTITEKLNGKLPIVKANFGNIIVAKVIHQYKYTIQIPKLIN